MLKYKYECFPPCCITHSEMKALQQLKLMSEVLTVKQRGDITVCGCSVLLCSVSNTSLCRLTNPIREVVNNSGRKKKKMASIDVHRSGLLPRSVVVCKTLDTSKIFFILAKPAQSQHVGMSHVGQIPNIRAI